MIRRSVKYPEENDSYRKGRRPKVRIAVADWGRQPPFDQESARASRRLPSDRIQYAKYPVDAEVIVFPGVGAFDRAMERLMPYRETIVDRLNAGTPCLGICVGAQILFERSEAEEIGLGFFKGDVIKMHAERVPHMGWNEVKKR